jgi:Divergent InlB B-repeat domain
VVATKRHERGCRWAKALTKSAARGYRFAGWRGACTGRRACILHPKAAVKVTAIFRKRRS